ncbi:MAG: hypothetical protein PF637_09350 [Spirochaetes bacterium]|jgi:acetyl/propionyl-CoA carboxylase alpha subunit/acetyl-CoA carboxylase carboxyltransferase component|nr:hypothetical protein [Spirochaetota bacterium]
MSAEILKAVNESIERLEELNPEINSETIIRSNRPHRLKKVVVANRGEIAKRFFLSLHEEEIPSVAIVTEVDRGQSWYEFADEVVFIGEETNYTNIPVVIGAASLVEANAIYAGYGFLSENAGFVESIDEYSKQSSKELFFMGPTSAAMRLMGDKVSSRELAKKHGVPLFESTECVDSSDIESLKKEIAEVGYPVIVKLSSGGGGKGMYPVFKDEELKDAVDSCVRIGKELYNDSRFFIEQYIQEPVHIEVQVFNDRALGIRKCAVQRRNQKIIEEAGHTFLPDHLAFSFLSAAERLAIESGYGNCGAGTVEFLIDAATGKVGFMEMNTRLQVEYGVTDQSLGIDLAKWQILYFDGRGDEIEDTAAIKYRYFARMHSIECRIYAEEPENDYRPSPGTITEINLPAFNGIRCDFGFGEGDKILSMYDPMIGKLIAYASDREEALIRMERALQELYIKGVKTNINQLLKIVRHDSFKDKEYTNLLIPKNDELGFLGPDHKYLSAASSSRQIIFGAFGEYVKYLYENAQKFSVVAASKGILDTEAADFPYRFNVEFEGESHLVEFVHENIDMVHVLLNNKYRGKLSLHDINDRLDDLALSFDSRIRRVRIERHIGFSVVRMKDDGNKYNYYRMTIVPEGVEEADTTGHVCSPFQGTFVSFAGSYKVGDKVSAGDKLLILSAMKMETIITSPVDGTISYIIEDGDVSKLQIGTTTDGRVIGKAVQEGEVMFRIDSEKSVEESSSEVVTLKADDTDNTYELLFAEGGTEKLLEGIDNHFDSLMDLFVAMIKGFLRQSAVIERLKEILNKLPKEKWKGLMTREHSDKICELILHYTYVRRLYSLVVSDEGFSFPDELDNFIRGWSSADVEFSDGFYRMLMDTFNSYKIRRWKRGAGNNRSNIYRFLYFLNLSYESILSNWSRIGKQMNIVGNLDPTSPLTQQTLQKLVEHTGHQIDDSSQRFLKHVVDSYFPDREAELYAGSGDGQNGEIACSTCKDMSSLSAVKKVDGGDALFSLISSGDMAKGTCSYDKVHSLLFCTNESITAGFMSSSCPVVSSVADCCAAVKEALGAFSQITADLKVDQKRFELVLQNSEFSFVEKHGEGPGYPELVEISKPLFKSILAGHISYGLIHTDLRVGEKPAPIIFKVASVNNNMVIDILFEDDPSNPYCNKEASVADVKMYQLDKWPVDRWASMMFDDGKFEEVTVDLIDSGEKPVGSKIFIGKVAGSDACFYMKDYRIIGGATGNREGLKYSAACYLAYMKGWPLYVWNDSAGANIKEGMVSLNRGGQGFMMNSLLAANVPLKKFKNYVTNIYDEQVKSVLGEMDQKYGLSLDEERGDRKTMVVAIGTGASAGLDVYGSSQATVQIILDSENSYRVLTGSNVIKSVMGEDISNYDIGGATILGKWTGIVDLIACDKPDMIRKLNEIQYLFNSSSISSNIIRSKDRVTTFVEKYTAAVVDEAMIRNNVDNSRFYLYKENYYASGALIAGFALLGGTRALIMGARTNSGLRSKSCVTKGRELLRMAYRTATPQILIYGDNWIRRSTSGTHLRAYYDFMNELTSRSSHRIHIVTSVAALQNFEVTSCADAVIFVKKEALSALDEKFASQNASFVVENMEEAFDVSARILTLLENRKTDAGKPGSGKITVPDDKGTPFDIIDSVITPAFDDASFVEFYAPFNQPSGPNLVTGLARIDGETVGIIADQPKIKGGGADALGTEKFRVFTRFLNSKGIPLVMLSNSSGFVPGSQQERYRIQAIGADSLDENVLGEIPVVSVVLNQNYGGRQIHAFSKSLRPGIYYTARHNATLAVMGATAAYDLLGAKHYNRFVAEGKQAEADAYQKKFMDDYLTKAMAENDATETGVVDSVFKDVSGLRSHIAESLIKAKSECETAFKN